VWRDRSAKGEANGRAKLTEARVLVILAQHEAGVSQRRLAARFGVSVRTIHNIINRKAWNHVGSQYDLL
jgi:transposase